MGLVLHCKLKYRVWPHANMGRLRPKIFFTSKYLPKRPHGTKFQQNPRNGGSQRCHEIENLSVKKSKNTLKATFLLKPGAETYFDLKKKFEKTAQ